MTVYSEHKERHHVDLQRPTHTVDHSQQ